MRLPVLIVALAAAAPIGFWTVSASAQFFEGQSVLGGRMYGPQEPWCSHQDIGGNVEEDCSFRSFEQCRRIAMGVNNAFCTHNPAYNMNIRPIRTKKGNRRRR
jgi:hypothetical protein